MSLTVLFMQSDIHFQTGMITLNVCMIHLHTFNVMQLALCNDCDTIDGSQIEYKVVTICMV